MVSTRKSGWAIGADELLDTWNHLPVRTGLTDACMLIRTERGKFDQVAKNLRQINGVKRVFAVLGRYDVVVEVEAANAKQVANAVLKANRQAGVVYTETLLEVEA